MKKLSLPAQHMSHCSTSLQEFHRFPGTLTYGGKYWSNDKTLARANVGFGHGMCLNCHAHRSRGHISDQMNEHRKRFCLEEPDKVRKRLRIL